MYDSGERVPEHSAVVWDRGPAGDFGKDYKCNIFGRPFDSCMALLN